MFWHLLCYFRHCKVGDGVELSTLPVCFCFMWILRGFFVVKSSIFLHVLIIIIIIIIIWDQKKWVTVPEYPAQQEQRPNELQSARERKFIQFSLAEKKFEAAGVVAPPPPVTLQPGTQHATRLYIQGNFILLIAIGLFNGWSGIRRKWKINKKIYSTSVFVAASSRRSCNFPDQLTTVR